MISKVLCLLAAVFCLASAASISVDERVPLLAAANVTVYEDSLGDDDLFQSANENERVHPSIVEDSRLTTVCLNLCL